MTEETERLRLAGPHPGTTRPALHAMLEAGSVAIVGASARPGTFGERMITEVGKSSAKPAEYLVNPKYSQIGGQRCYSSLADLPGPVDLVMLGVPDAALEAQLTLAASHGARSAVIFGNAYEDARKISVQPRLDRDDHGRGLSASRPDYLSPDADARTTSAGHPEYGADRPSLRKRLAAIAGAAGMELCGAGCMGFVNAGYGLRAIGYVEPDPLPAGPVALVTHSGSVFSALLRTRRAIGFTLAVSSGQELVTTAGSYLSYALELPATRVLALVLEAIRQPDQLRTALAAAAERDLPVVLLAAGTSASGKAMVAAHSGALAGADGGWEALARAYGVHRVADLAEMADTLELFALRVRPGRRSSPDPPQPNRGDGPLHRKQPRRWPVASVGQTWSDDHGSADDARKGTDSRFSRSRGIATVHDSGLERAHAVDLAAELGVPYAEISEQTKRGLADLLDPGLVPANPLDVWGTGADTRQLFAGSLVALAQDDAVGALALAVDLVTELDGDDAYQLAALDAAQRTDKPIAVVSNLASVIDPDAAALLRGNGIPVLEGLRSGLLALRHLLDHVGAGERRALAADRPGAADGQRPAADVERTTTGRRERARALLAAGQHSGEPLFSLLGEYGITAVRARRVTDSTGALAAAAEIGYPVVIKTDEPGIAHKSDVHGVILAIGHSGQLAEAYADLAARLGPAALVCETAPSGVELALGIVRDHALGPLLVVGTGGVLVELLSDRIVALPPVGPEQARELLAGLAIGKLLAGARGAAAADVAAVVRAIVGLSDLAIDLGDSIEALDINPLICGPHGAIAVDALVVVD